MLRDVPRYATMKIHYFDRKLEHQLADSEKNRMELDVLLPKACGWGTGIAKQRK